MVQIYKCSIKCFAFIMALITKLMRKTKPFIWTIKCQEAWNHIKKKYMETPIMIPPNWQMEFHVHTDASLLAMGAMLAYNPTSKYDQPIVYASRLLNKVKQNYITTEIETLVMVYALYKFKHFLFGNKFVFYVIHIALVYLVNKPQVLGRIARWLLLFLEYEFIVVYKPSKTHVVIDVLSRLPDSSEPLGVPNQTMDMSLFYVKPVWMQEVKTYIETDQMPETLNLT
jgi:hypothetical protein